MNLLSQRNHGSLAYTSSNMSKGKPPPTTTQESKRASSQGKMNYVFARKGKEQTKNFEEAIAMATNVTTTTRDATAESSKDDSKHIAIDKMSEEDIAKAYTFFSELYPGTIEWENQLNPSVYKNTGGTTFDGSTSASEQLQKENSLFVSRANEYSIRWRSRAFTSSGFGEFGQGAAVAVANDSSFVALGGRRLRLYNFVDVNNESSDVLEDSKRNFVEPKSQRSEPNEAEISFEENYVGDSTDSEGYSLSEEESDLDDRDAAKAQRDHFRQQRKWRQRPLRGGILDSALQVLRPTFLHANPETDYNGDKLTQQSKVKREDEVVMSAVDSNISKEKKEIVSLAFEERNDLFIRAREKCRRKRYLSGSNSKFSVSKRETRQPSSQGLQFNSRQQQRVQRLADEPFRTMDFGTVSSLSVSVDNWIAASHENGITFGNLKDEQAKGTVSRPNDQPTLVRWCESPTPNISVQPHFIPTYIQSQSDTESCKFDSSSKSFWYYTFGSGSDEEGPAVQATNTSLISDVRWCFLASYASGRIELVDARAPMRANPEIVAGSITSDTTNHVRDIIVCPQNPLLYGWISDFSIKVRDLRKPKGILADLNDSLEPQCADWHPTDPSLIAVGGQGGARIWSLTDLMPGSSCNSVNSRRNQPSVTEIKTKEACCQIKWRDKRPYELALSLQFADSSIYLYDTRRPYRARGVLPGHTSSVSQFAWSHYGDQLVSTGSDSDVLTHDLRTAWKPLSVASACSLAWSPLGQLAIFAQPLPRDQSLVARSGSTPSAIHTIEEALSKCSSLNQANTICKSGFPEVDCKEVPYSSSPSCNLAVFPTESGFKLVDVLFPQVGQDPLMISCERAMNQQNASQLSSPMAISKTPAPTPMTTPRATPRGVSTWNTSRHVLHNQNNTMQRLSAEKRATLNVSLTPDVTPASTPYAGSRPNALLEASLYTHTAVPGEASEPGYVAVLFEEALPTKPTDKMEVFRCLATGYFFNLHSAMPVVISGIRSAIRSYMGNIVQQLSEDSTSNICLPFIAQKLPINLRRVDLFLAVCSNNANVARKAGAILQARIWGVLHAVAKKSHDVTGGGFHPQNWVEDFTPESVVSNSLHLIEDSSAAVSENELFLKNLGRPWLKNAMVVNKCKTVQSEYDNDQLGSEKTIYGVEVNVTKELLSRHKRRHSEQALGVGVDDKQQSSGAAFSGDLHGIAEVCASAIDRARKNEPASEAVSNILPYILNILLKNGDMQTLSAILITMRQAFFEVESSPISGRNPASNLPPIILFDKKEIDEDLQKLWELIGKDHSSPEEERIYDAIEELPVFLAFSDDNEAENTLKVNRLEANEEIRSPISSSRRVQAKQALCLLRRLRCLPHYLKPSDIKLMPSSPPLAFLKFGLIPPLRQRDIIYSAAGLLERQMMRIRVTELYKFRGCTWGPQVMTDAPQFRFAIDSGSYWPRAPFSQAFLFEGSKVELVSQLRHQFYSKYQASHLQGYDRASFKHMLPKRQDANSMGSHDNSLMTLNSELDDTLRSSSGAAAGICVVCQRSFSGIVLVCAQCGHGGHLQHMLEWWTDASDQNEGFQDEAKLNGEEDMYGDFSNIHKSCPSGCGHMCLSQDIPRGPDFIDMVADALGISSRCSQTLGASLKIKFFEDSQQ